MIENVSWRARGRRLLLAGVDGAAWAVALAAVTWFRHTSAATPVDSFRVLQLVSVALGAHWSVGWVARLYRGRHGVGSPGEAVRLIWVMIGVGLIVLVVDLALPVPRVSPSVPLMSTFFAVVLAVVTRWAIRWSRERSARRDRISVRQRVIILGAGDGGQRLVRSMLADPASDYLPVALLDDEPGKRPPWICDVPVCGTHEDLADVVARTGATLLVIATRDVDSSVLRKVSRAAREIGLGVRVLRPLSELFRPRASAANLREPDIAELLGRPQIDTRIDAIGGYLAHRRILVTGAGGSIGSELCRQIHRFGPAALYMLDRDESALHAVRLSIHGTALLDSSDVVLADICDAEAVHTVFEECRPDVVFHAAALKHLPILEQYPLEAWKTNVLGTHHVLEAARSAGVHTFVNVSTDKAANPSSVLGYSKRVGERLTAEMASRAEGCYLSVRFGNVLGSRGSMLTTFTEQLAKGNPITITHPDVTRYFMTIGEAVQLVIQAAAIGRSGEALVFDMGEPVRIVDIARQLMEMSGRSTPIVYTGLRAGEKLHEECFGVGESDLRPMHPAISHITVPPLDLERLRSLAVRRGEVAAMAECAIDLPGPRAANSTHATRGVPS